MNQLAIGEQRRLFSSLRFFFGCFEFITLRIICACVCIMQNKPICHWSTFIYLRLRNVLISMPSKTFQNRSLIPQWWIDFFWFGFFLHQIHWHWGGCSWNSQFFLFITVIAWTQYTLFFSPPIPFICHAYIIEFLFNFVKILKWNKNERMKRRKNNVYIHNTNKINKKNRLLRCCMLTEYCFCK